MKRYALVIGIGEYDSPNLGRLTKPANDAKAVADILRSHGNFQAVKLLNGTNAKPGWVDYGTLYRELTNFLQQAAHQDALIYFTGHGFTLEESRFVRRGYLATSSCRVKIKEGRIISQEEAFSFDDLNGLIQEASLSSLLMLLDCCHSGLLIEDDLVKKSLLTFDRTNYFLISACRSFQQAYALKSKEYSVFTGMLLESLSEAKARKGVVTALDAFGHIECELQGSKQEPIFLGAGGAIPIVRYDVVTEAAPDDTCPYQGLEAFTEETAQFFFGRQKDVEALWQRLGQSNFVPVIGASGSGKSSLVRAGLVPVLKQSGTNWIVLEPIKPGEEPLTQLRKPLEELVRQIPGKVQLGTLLRKAPEGLQPLIEQLPDAVRFLLVVDQFEEVFTVFLDEGEQARFIHLMTQVAAIPDSRLAVVMTMRADFVEPCLRYDALKQLIQTQAVYLSPLSGADLTDAIAKPAAKQGYRLTPDLLAEMVKDTREEPGFLPLLQFALTKLWEVRDTQAHELTTAAYVTIGKLTGALDAHAEQIYTYSDYIDPNTGEMKLAANQRRSQMEQDWIRAILLRLVRTSEGEKDTRQRQARSGLLELAGKTADAQQLIGIVLESLIKGRLLVSDQETIDLAHEALIQGWQRLDSWCQESRELRRLSQRMEAARLEWEKDQQNPNLTLEEKDRNLMMGGLLAEVREQWQALIPYLQDFGKDEPFWQRSDTHEQDRITTLQRALTESKLRELAARAQHLVSVQPRIGLELAVQAMGENLENIPAQLLSTVQGSLNQAMNLARLSNKLKGHERSISSVAFSPDGTCIISGSDDNTIRLWDLVGNPVGEPFWGHKDYINSVAFSPDGKRIVSSDSDKTIRLWDLAGNPIGQPFLGHEAAVWSVAFSPDGTRIVSGSDDETIRLWDLAGNPIEQPFLGHEAAVWSVAFSPDGTHIVSGSTDETIRLWDLAGKPIGQPFQGHEDYIRSVAFSPNGTRIISGSDDATLRLWDLAGNPIGQPFVGHKAAVRSVAFSPDGACIVSSSDDKTLRLWDLAGNLIGQPFVGHEAAVWSVTFSPDGTCVASGSDDSTIRLWDVVGDSIGQPVQAHEAAVWSVAFSPDGTYIVSGGTDEAIRLWDSAGKPIGKPFQGHESAVWSVAFSPDNRHIVSGSANETICLWDLAGNPIGYPFVGHEDNIWSVAFSPDGTRIASGSADKTIRLWDLAGDPIGYPFVGHEDNVWSVAFSPDGTRIVSGSADGTVRLWDLAGNPVSQPFVGHKAAVRSVAFSPDGTCVISGSDDNTIRLWDLVGNPIGQPLQGHEFSVWSVAFSPNGACIVSGSADKTIRLWDLMGNPIGQPLQGHKDIVRSVAFSPDSTCIISSGDDTTIRLWRGNWRSWLGVCSVRLGYHLVSEDPEINILTDDPSAILRSDDPAITSTQKACAACQKYAWNDEDGRKELARMLRRQSSDLARSGKPQLAAERLRQAITYDPKLQAELEKLERSLPS